MLASAWLSWASVHLVQLLCEGLFCKYVMGTNLLYVVGLYKSDMLFTVQPVLFSSLSLQPHSLTQTFTDRFTVSQDLFSDFLY